MRFLTQAPFIVFMDFKFYRQSYKFIVVFLSAEIFHLGIGVKCKMFTVTITIVYS